MPQRPRSCTSPRAKARIRRTVVQEEYAEQRNQNQKCEEGTRDERNSAPNEHDRCYVGSAEYENSPESVEDEG
ncbi:hypothetical protein K438DRAFT_1831564 [Mycena galopus ATCC 62051]|nr:hypothetical protein K438DRAFT_1831564 [Mycena galopus ATCC 62051]